MAQFLFLSIAFHFFQINTIVTEESLRSLFGQFGEVFDAVICKSHVDQVYAYCSSCYCSLFRFLFSSERIAKVAMDLFIITEIKKVFHHPFVHQKH
jgi:RNA recognition motif-containing protein